MVKAIQGMMSQCRFNVHIGKSKSRCRTLVNGVPQGSVIAPALFNLYTNDMRTTVSRKYIYADDIGIMVSDKCFTVVEQTLSDDLDKLRNYFYYWRLKLNTTKTVCSSFHLTNRFADYELSITIMGERIPFDKTQKDLGVTLDCTLSYHQHLLNTAAKVSKRCRLLKRLASHHWGADFFLFFCCRILLSNMESKPSLLKLRHRFRLVSGCIKSTPTELLPILSGIETVDIRQNKNILGLCIRAMESTHFFTRPQYLHLQMLDSKEECHYEPVCTV